MHASPEGWELLLVEPDLFRWEVRIVAQMRSDDFFDSIPRVSFIQCSTIFSINYVVVEPKDA